MAMNESPINMHMLLFPASLGLRVLINIPSSPKNNNNLGNKLMNEKKKKENESDIKNLEREKKKSSINIKIEGIKHTTTMTAG